MNIVPLMVIGMSVRKSVYQSNDWWIVENRLPCYHKEKVGRVGGVACHDLKASNRLVRSLRSSTVVLRIGLSSDLGRFCQCSYQERCMRKRSTSKRSAHRCVLIRCSKFSTLVKSISFIWSLKRGSISSYVPVCS